VFHSRSNESDPGLTCSATDDGRNSFLKGDGTEVHLPGKYQLFTIIDGQDHHSNQRVTMKELDAFFDSSPHSFTIDNIEKFVADRRR
jgi:hypothetical protein